MSLVERPHGRALPRIFAALLMGLALSGCIEPLYRPLSTGGDVVGEMQAIAVEPIPNSARPLPRQRAYLRVQRHRIAGASEIPAYCDVNGDCANSLDRYGERLSERRERRGERRLPADAGREYRAGYERSGDRRCQLRPDEPKVRQSSCRARCRDPQRENARRSDPHPRRGGDRGAGIAPCGRVSAVDSVRGYTKISF